MPRMMLPPASPDPSPGPAPRPADQPQDYSLSPLADLLNALAARQPIPGGGSAAALNAAIACALAQMAAAYSTGPRYAAHAGRIGQIQHVLAEIRTSLLEAAVLDQRAYLALRAAGTSPAAPFIIEAARVPQSVAQGCLNALQHTADLLRVGNPHLASDARAAGRMLHAAGLAALEMVRVNLDALPAQERAAAGLQPDALAGYLDRALADLLAARPAAAINP